MKKLINKSAVVYGTGGTGEAIAKAFAAEGAHVFIAGRNADKLAVISKAITAQGGKVETTVVDLLNENEVNVHFEGVLTKTNSVDISYNAFGLPQTGLQGKALTEVSVTDFMRPLENYLLAQFLTVRAALRQMAVQKSGVILTHIPNAGKISHPFIGGMPSTWAAIEALNRSIPVEYGKDGVRSVCLITTAIPETPLIDEVFEIHGRSHGVGFEEFTEVMNSMTHRNKLTTLKELTNAAVFAASEEGSAISGTTFNLTAGMIIT
jgi:NAD(P)-dependent dehydrogenase (short-subunit alcohol dehydrogenase family)